MVSDISQIVLHFLVMGQVRAAVNLGQAGHSRLYLVPLAELRRPMADDLRDVRPRPDQAHLAADYIEQLRQLIDSGLAKRPADGGGVARAAARAEQALLEVAGGH